MDTERVLRALIRESFAASAASNSLISLHWPELDTEVK